MGASRNLSAALVVVSVRMLLCASIVAPSALQPKNHADIIKHMAKLVNTIVVPMARASILWLIGEYSELVPKIAPDVLRNMAKTFVGEDDIVKLQILNLATKLMITNHKQTHVLAQYVFNLAKYDASYDIRDRARLLRAMIFPAEKGAGLAKYAKKVFLASKPAPMPESSYKDRDSLQLGSLSLMINQKASGYRELPPFPDAPPDPSVRNVVEPVTWTAGTKKKKPVKAGKAEKEKAFYSDDDESESTGPDGSSAEEAEDSGAEEKDEDDEDEESTEEESSESDSDEEEEETEKSESSEEESESESDSSESDSSEASSDEEPQTKKTPTKAAPPAKATPPKATPPKETKPAPAKKGAKKEENLLDLLDFGGEDSGTSQVIPNAAAMLVPRTADARQAASESRPAAVAASSIFGLDSVVSGQHVVAEQEYEFLNRITGGGLVAAYRFPRTACLHSPRMVAVEVRLTNQGSEEVKAIKLTGSKLPSGVQLASFNEIALLAPNGSSMQTIGLNLNDSTQPVNLEVCTAERQFAVTLKAPVGELVAPKPLQETAFNEAQAKLRGMNETSSAATLRNPLQGQEFAKAVVRIVNLIQVPSSESQTFKFSGQTVSGQAAVLVACKVNANQVQLTVNCDKLVVGSMLAKELKEALERL